MCGHNHLSGADILANLPDMLPGSSRAIKADAAILIFDDIFNHHHCITACRNGVAGIDNHKLLRS